MASNLPVRRPTTRPTTLTSRTTSTARGAENIIKPSTTRASVGGKTLAGTSNRLLAPTASSKAKQAGSTTENGKDKEKLPIKRKREVLTEVTERNGTAASKRPAIALKGKEKATSSSDDGQKAAPRTRQPFGLVSGKPVATVSSTTTATTTATATSKHSKTLSVSSFSFIPQPTESKAEAVPPTLSQEAEGPKVFKRKSAVEREQRAAREASYDEAKQQSSDHTVDEDDIAAQLVPSQPDEDDTGMYDDLDAEDWLNPQECVEYVHEILAYMKETDIATAPKPNYMSEQQEISWAHREKLFDWLISVHNQFRFGQESLFLTLNVIDRFLSLRQVSISKLQLVGTAAFLVATKFEESMSPSVSQLACEGMTAEEIKVAERYLLRELDWNLSYSGPMTWLRRGSKADGYDPQARTFAKFLIEIGFLEWRMVGIPPSQLAAAAMWLSRLALDREDWNATMAHYTTYKETDLIPIANTLLNYIAKPVKLTSVYKKYASRKLYKVSIMMRTWVVQTWGEGANINLAADLPHIKAAIQERRIQTLLEQEQNEQSLEE